MKLRQKEGFRKEAPNLGLLIIYWPVVEETSCVFLNLEENTYQIWSKQKYAKKIFILTGLMYLIYIKIYTEIQFKYL